MAMEYHVVIIPLPPWESCIPRTISELTTLMQVVNRYFSFKSMEYQTAGLSKRRSILNERLPLLRHEVKGIHEITDVVKKEAKDIADELNIEDAYATNFALEIVSSSTKILDGWTRDLNYGKLSSRLIPYLFEPELPFYSSVEGIDATSLPTPSVATCRVVLCDNIREVKKLGKELKLKKITNMLYIGSKKPGVRCNIFNFIPRKPWYKVFVLGPVVTLKPDKIGADYRTNEELGYLLAFVHSLGKFYVISESIRGFCTAIEWRSWFIEDLWRKYEKEFGWWKRTFFHLEEDIYGIQVELHETIYPLVRLISSPQVQQLMARQYGVEPIPYWTEFSQLLDMASKYKIPSDQIRKSVFDDLKMLAAKLTEFLDQFSKSIDAHLRLRSFKVGYNQLLLTIIGTAAVLLSVLVSVFLGLLLLK